ncbi:MAG: DUF308 domain-containing protein [FCB group bacterium]|nr:DUF308 domain-containing protein [FCB group bacterium]
MKAGCSSAVHAAALFGLFLILLASALTQFIVIIAPALLLWGIVRFLRAKERPSRRSDAIFLIIIGSIGLLLGMDEWRRMLHPPREARHRAACQDNLRTIGRALDAYALANAGVRPVTLGALFPKYLPKPDLERLVCPSSEDSVGAPDRIDAWTSYEYNPTGKEWLCRDKQDTFHIPEGRHVLTADGQVYFRNTKDVACQENLRRIGRALDMYAAANRGQRPEHLSALYPDYISHSELKTLQCPYRAGPVRPTDSIDEWTDYEYNPSGEDWICRDRQIQHQDGRNVLLPNGTVEFVKERPPR